MQTLLQSFEWLNKTVQPTVLTVSDKAAAIYRDAVDTANNLSKACDLLGNIYEVLIDYADKGIGVSIDQDLIQSVIDSLGSDKEVTLFDFISDNGSRGVKIAYLENYEIAYHEFIDVIGYYSTGALVPILVNAFHGATSWYIFSSDAVIVYPSGDVDIRLESVIGSEVSFRMLAADLADAFGVSTLISTITNSLATGSTSLADVCSTVSTSVKNLGPTAREMWTDVLQNCGQSPEAILDYISNLYSGFVNAEYSTTSNETKQNGYIVMDHDTTHYVKSFSSTAVWSIVSTGLQYAGMALMMVGGAALKVIGGIITGGITLINKITEVGSNLDTTAKVNYQAPNSDFNIPLWWKSWTNTAPFTDSHLKEQIDDLRTVVIHLPLLDVYMWYNDENNGDRTYNAQAYLRIDKQFNFNPTQSYNGVVQPLISYDGAHTYTTLRSCRASEHVSSDTAFTMAMVDDYLSAGDYTLGWSMADQSTNLTRTQIAMFSDDRLSLTIANNLALIAIIGNSKNDTRTIYTPTFDGNNHLVWSTSDLNKNIGNALHCVNSIQYFDEATWEAIVNYFIPTIKNDSDDVIYQYIIKTWLQTQELCEEYPDYLTLNSNWVIIQDGYFLVEHPNYTKNAIMLIALASCAILAIGVIAVVVTKKAISTKIRRKMLQRRLKLSQMRSQVNPDDFSTIKAYDKANKRYNFLATICGYPTVDAFNDWVNEEASTNKPTDSNQPVQDLVTAIRRLIVPE